MTPNPEYPAILEPYIRGTKSEVSVQDGVLYVVFDLTDAEMVEDRLDVPGVRNVRQGFRAAEAAGAGETLPVMIDGTQVTLRFRVVS